LLIIQRVWLFNLVLVFIKLNNIFIVFPGTSAMHTFLAFIPVKAGKPLLPLLHALPQVENKSQKVKDYIPDKQKKQ
jgi:hypothetical protein